ncbi:hypothetical protein EYF80_027384 [Liparis tanakae]|uniref:Uncharacterized protein n=1 Tax=Liparis tanakae TaxID=230148 RepID=A0A4Z2HBJ5_9TELE|nr:hypothetical protein EYF80_027384 [Liparis tanakae]
MEIFCLPEAMKEDGIPSVNKAGYNLEGANLEKPARQREEEEEEEEEEKEEEKKEEEEEKKNRADAPRVKDAQDNAPG